MSEIFLILQKVHDSVHDLEYKKPQNILKQKNFSVPRIFTGGVDLNLWNQLSTSEKEKALSKDWYVYYSFRNEESGKLVRMPNIKGGANKLKKKAERLQHLNALRDALEYLLEKGFNPNSENNSELLAAIKPETMTIATTIATTVATTVANEPTIVIKPVITENDSLSIKDAFDFALKIKKNSISLNSYKNFELRVRKFKKYLDDTKPITIISKKIVTEYLNEVLEKTSPRNRNNTRTDLSGLFQVLEDNEIVSENFIKKINVLVAKPERNKTYTPEMQKDIYDFLEINDPILLLFIKFVSYNFLRPVEVCRLKIKDIDLVDRKLYLRAKNKKVKIKIIPEILLKELPNFSELNSENYLFTPTGYGHDWEATENNRRDSFTKRFKFVVKDHFNLGIDYGMYSFRHTFITRLYRELRKNNSQFQTKSTLMLITGHSTMTALEQYLRDIDAELPEDYSNLLK